MGLVKTQMMEDEANEEMYEWIRENASPDVEEDDEEWNTLKEQYLHGSHVADDYWDGLDYEDEIQWYSKEELAFSLFNQQMSEIRGSLSENNSPIVLKMKFAYIVTLMESCLGDILIGTVLSDEYYLVNAMKKVTELSSTRLTLLEIHNSSDVVNKTVLMNLARIVYHKIDKVIDLYKNVLGEVTPKAIQEKKENIKNIVILRHDIVHRNGYDHAGKEHEITVAMYTKAVDDVVDFVQSMHEYAQRAKANYLFKDSPF
ncbi:hypothetical protein [Serratia proteamaculans]|uniref:hypothetical protein n=1 Tax=Serratia proteamaculans TaxID=28151 RepID=UPI0039AF4F5A